MKKRLLSALLVLAMVLSLVPFGAFAADATEPVATLETQATEPAKATEPTQATEPAKATEPTKETEATDATETTEPTVPATTAPSAPTAVEKVQSLIDALPETVTAENRAEVENQLTAIDDAKLPLTDEERDTLDFGKYNAAIAALDTLDGQPGAQVPDSMETGYTITFDPAGGTLPEGVANTATTNADGKLASLPTPTREGYTFDGWYRTKQNGPKVTTEFTFTENITLYAHWKVDAKFSLSGYGYEKVIPDIQVTSGTEEINFSGEPKYGVDIGIVAFEISENYPSDIANNSVLSSGKFNVGLCYFIWIKFQMKEGYSLGKVTLDGQNAWEQTVNGNTVQVAFQLPTVGYTITLDPNGGTLPDGVANTVTTDKDGKFATLPTPTKSDNAFLGWYNGETKWSTDSFATENITLTAKWSDGTNVTSEEELRACIEAGISTIKLGADIALTSALNISGKTLTLDLNGHVLSKQGAFYTSLVRVEKSGSLTIKDSGTGGKISDYVYGNASAITLESGTVEDTLEVSNGSTLTMNGGTVNRITANATVYVNGGKVNNSIFMGMDGILYANGMDIPALSDSGVFPYKIVTCKVGDKVYCYTIKEKPVAPTAPEGETFQGWYKDNQEWDFSKGSHTEGTTVTAKFAPITYTITYNKGEITDAKGDIDKVQKECGDDKFTLSQKVYTKDGYLQVGWEDAQSNFYLPGAAYKENANLTLTAVWEKIITYKVPFTKTVKLSGSAKPGKVTFELHALPYGDYSQTPGKVDVTGTVETNGKGDYNKGTLTISGSEKLLEQMLSDGILVQEKNDGKKNWTYDSTIYCLKMTNNGIALYPVTAKTANQRTDYVIDYSKTVKTMTFTNTYGTSSNADTSNPKTGDEIYIAAATMLLSAMALIAILPGKKRM